MILGWKESNALGAEMKRRRSSSGGALSSLPFSHVLLREFRIKYRDAHVMYIISRVRNVGVFFRCSSSLCIH